MPVATVAYVTGSKPRGSVDVWVCSKSGARLDWGFECSLWDTRSGQQVGPALQHEGPVSGAQFSHDESRILTWNRDHTARIWPLSADLDFPAEHFELWIKAVTGSELDLVTQQVKTLDGDRWFQIRQRYEVVAVDHARICKYPDANEWLREQKELVVDNFRADDR